MPRRTGPQRAPNQFQLLWDAYPKTGQGGGQELANSTGFIDVTDTSFDVYRRLAIKSITPDIFADTAGATKTGYILRTGETEPEMNLAKTAFKVYNDELWARCMILDGYETQCLPLPNGYDETWEDRITISQYPQFKYPAKMSGDIVRGAFVNLQFFQGTLQQGIIIGRQEVPPLTLASVNRASTALGAFEAGIGGTPQFLYETVVANPETTELSEENSGFFAAPVGEKQVSPFSTFAIPEDYFYPSRFRETLARAISSLDDVVKLRFARAVKKFIVQNFSEGLDIKMNFGYRSRKYQDYLWKLEHEGILQADGTRIQRSTGAVRGGNSWHNYGMAADVLVWIEGNTSPTGRQESGGWFDEAALAGSVYHQQLRTAMLTEGLYNPLDGVQTGFADPGHFQPVEFPIEVPRAVKKGRETIFTYLRETDSPIRAT